MSHTSTETRARGGAGEKRRRASFRRSFSITVAALLILCAAFLGLGYYQGAKLSSAQVDTKQVVAQSGQQLRLFTNQAIAKVRADQVTITPATDFTVSSGGSIIAVQFRDTLHYATKYTVSVRRVTSLYEQQPSTIRYSFTTAGATLFYLHRARPNEPQQVDHIYQTGLKGAVDKEVYSAPHIQEFAVFPTALAVVTLNADKTNSLSLVNLSGRAVENVMLPTPGGAIDSLQTDATAGVLGFVFTPGGGADVHDSSTLMTLNFNLAHTVTPVLGLNGKPAAVLSWLFLPGSTSIVAQTTDQSLMLVDALHPAKPTPLGYYSALNGVSPDGASLVVGDSLGNNFAYSLASGKETPLLPVAIDGAVPFGGDLVLIGRGTARVQKVATYNETTAKYHIPVVYEDGTNSKVLFQSVDGTDSIEGISVSPNGQYVVVEETLDTAHSVSDGYLRNARSRNVATVIVDIATGATVRTLDGFDVNWG
ncbi:MAG: hypothetical protein ABI400_13825 [Lacisediminihabitans sp.]